MISRSTIDRVFESARVEEVIGEFVQLKKAGSNFKGLSPFTDEKEFNVTKEYADVKLNNTTLKKLKAAS